MANEHPALDGERLDCVRRAAGLAGIWEGVRYQAYATADGHVLFMASEQAFWRNFCEGVGRMDLFERWPGSAYADHARGNTGLQRELAAVFAARTCAQWLDFGSEVDTPIAPFNTPANIGDDPQFQARIGFLPAEDMGCEQLPLPVFVDGDKPPTPTKAPTVGQHTDEVMAQVLGLEADRIASLRAGGAPPTTGTGADSHNRGRPDSKPESRRRLRLTPARRMSPGPRRQP